MTAMSVFFPLDTARIRLQGEKGERASCRLLGKTWEQGVMGEESGGGYYQEDYL